MIDLLPLETKENRGLIAFEWLLPSYETAAKCTDSQSFLKVIQSGSTDTSDLRRMLEKRADTTTLLWIPVYQWIASNEEVNACATTIIDGAL